MKNIPILVVEDHQQTMNVFVMALHTAGFAVVTADTKSDAQRQFELVDPVVVIVSLQLAEGIGHDLVREFATSGKHTHVIATTGDGSVDQAVLAMRAGAFEFLVKPVTDSRLIEAVVQAQGNSPVHAEIATIESSPVDFDPLIGTSKRMLEIFETINSLKHASATVFLTGEGGTGKTLVAQALHNRSNRKNSNFVPVNCAALPATGMEAEVFGQVKNGNPADPSERIGAFQRADGGTLFLDNICELDYSLQSTLLRFLETETILPIGAAQPQPVNARIICASNRDPKAEVAAGKFREDLFYRLQVVPIHLPPLRERPNDAIAIAEKTISNLSKSEGRNFEGLSPAVHDIFRQLPWPGNVRQLLNVLWNVVVLHDGKLVTQPMLPRDLISELDAPGHLNPEPQKAAFENKTLSQIEREAIEYVLARCDGSVPKAAYFLDVSPSTLYRKLDAWSKKPPHT